MATAQSSAAAPAAAAHGMSMPMIIGAIIVVIIIVVGAALLLTGSHSSTSGSGSGSGSTTGSGSKGSSGSTSVSGSTSGGGPGQYIMSDSEVSAIAGSGGTYNATSALDAEYFAHFTQNTSSYFYNNVTAVYVMAYSLNKSGSQSAVLELVFQSPKAQFLFDSAIKNATSTSFNVTNATSNGLTYDYAGVSETSGSYSFGSTILIGWKNQGFVEVLDIGAELPQTQLAATVAGDIP